jgi:hypothetical protein
MHISRGHTQLKVCGPYRQGGGSTNVAPKPNDMVVASKVATVSEAYLRGEM